MNCAETLSVYENYLQFTLFATCNHVLGCWWVISFESRITVCGDRVRVESWVIRVESQNHDLSLWLGSNCESFEWSQKCDPSYELWLESSHELWVNSCDSECRDCQTDERLSGRTTWNQPNNDRTTVMQHTDDEEYSRDWHKFSQMLLVFV